MAVSSYLHIYLGGSWFVAGHGRGREDTYMIDLPMFHGSGFWYATACLATGTKIVMRSKPALQSYWEIVRDHGVTMGLLLSTMVPFLLQQPERKAEREHKMRTMTATPLPRDLDAFMKRFNLAEVWGAYGLTEVPPPLVARAGDLITPTYCGQVRPGFQCRLVDENDIEVPAGSPGELVVRSDQPWMLTTGYANNPEATATSWRNGWFHTGDMMRLEEGGRFHFVDRAKDAVRRRGENVSSMEVEAELRQFPGIANVACVPHREADSIEDEVKVWVLAAEGVAVDFPELLRFAADRLPYFMVPRYFELADEFPMTHSMRVKKAELRALGNSDRTWDREAHGYRVTRNGLETSSARAVADA
jgi:crotonobetaine/carnitine-CoA ligase